MVLIAGNWQLDFRFFCFVRNDRMLRAFVTLRLVSYCPPGTQRTQPVYSFLLLPAAPSLKSTSQA
jgi:hypothetical protein